jgi:hypothetical protein
MGSNWGTVLRGPTAPIAGAHHPAATRLHCSRAVVAGPHHHSATRSICQAPPRHGTPLPFPLFEPTTQTHYRLSSSPSCRSRPLATRNPFSAPDFRPPLMSSGEVHSSLVFCPFFHRSSIPLSYPVM